MRKRSLLSEQPSYFMFIFRKAQEVFLLLFKIILQGKQLHLMTMENKEVQYISICDEIFL
jgi:hypothetical protein